MYRKVVNRKNIMIAKDLSAVTTGTFSANINLNFIPDEMIVKQIAYSGDPSARKIGTVRLYCQSINENLGAFFDGCVTQPDLVFVSKNYPFNSSWTFQIFDANGTLNTTMNDELFISLEFVQFQ